MNIYSAFLRNDEYDFEEFLFLKHNYWQVLEETADIGLEFLEDATAYLGEEVNIPAAGVGLPWCVDPVRGMVIDMTSPHRQELP